MILYNTEKWNTVAICPKCKHEARYNKLVDSYICLNCGSYIDKLDLIFVKVLTDSFKHIQQDNIDEAIITDSETKSETRTEEIRTEEEIEAELFSDDKFLEELKAENKRLKNSKFSK